MGGKKKKGFIDKKNSATFTLVARDSSNPNSSTERVFVRVDNRPFSVPGFLDEEPDEELGRGFNEESSVFADAPGDTDSGTQRQSLPEEIRRAILELGLPDDGYNYLLHLREIRNEGAGSAYYENPKARFDRVPLDVKAYDASKLRITSDSIEVEGSNVDSIYTVASKTAPVRMQKVVDADVARLLDDTDLSRFGSDLEDLEEDFVIRANQLEGSEEEMERKEDEGNKEVVGGNGEELGFDTGSEDEGDDELQDYGAKNRVTRLLDEQFDLLTMEEYNDDSEDGAGPAYNDMERETLAVKLKDALKDYGIEDAESEEKYRVPKESVTGDDESTQVIRRCAEYAKRYLQENQEKDEEFVLVPESSDESETFDCETVVSTYSNLENHPAKIDAPENPRKRFPLKMKTIPEFPFPGEAGGVKDAITLRGKQMIPVHYLPNINNKKRGESVNKEKIVPGEKPQRKANREESNQEKKERKAAVKSERREARKAKKEMKGLYKSETQTAQRVAAFSGPSSIPL